MKQWDLRALGLDKSERPAMEDAPPKLKEVPARTPRGAARRRPHLRLTERARRLSSSSIPLASAETLLVGLAYYAAAVLSLRVALVAGQVTPIWPPTGIALVGLLVFGRRVWPGIAIAAFLVNFPIGPSPLTAAGIAVGNTLAPLVAASLLQRVGFRAQLDRLRDAMAIVFLGALVSMAISATVGTATLTLSGSITTRAFLSTWSVWWTGDAMGVLVVAPFLLSLGTRSGSHRSWRSRAEFVACMLTLGIVARVVFQSGLQIEYLVFPFLLWAAWRFRQPGAAPAVLLVSATAVWAAEKSIGPFANGTLLTKMATLQIFNASVAFASFVLAAAVAERAQYLAERRSGEEALSRLASIVESSDDAIIGGALDGTILSWNHGAEQLYGYSEQEVLGQPISIIVPADRASETRRDLDRLARGERVEPYDTARIRKDRTTAPVSLTISPITDGEGHITGVSSIARDISERKQTEEEITFLAYHDQLTGLANRALFEVHLESALARATRHRLPVAVLYMDLDDFKLANDTLGHQTGDRVLVEVASRISRVARETDVVARQGGDEFLLLLSDFDRHPEGGSASPLEVAESVARRIQEELKAPFILDGTDLNVSASIGISLFPETARDARELLMKADFAMYGSKGLGPGQYLASSPVSTRGKGEASGVARLRKAVEERHWALLYQPIVDLTNKRIVAAEALIRWRDPSGEETLPAAFIPLAEKTGLIEPIGDWVLEEACRQSRGWRDCGLPLTTSINLSPRQLRQRDLAEAMLSKIDAAGVDPSSLVVEVTESVAMTGPKGTPGVLQSLHEHGIQLAIDDFGTGYSSLSRLKDLPIQILKIDRSFIRDLAANQRAASVVVSIIQLARSLGMVSLAEGIETEDQWCFLVGHGCSLGQGWYFGEPAPPEMIASRLSQEALLAPPTLGDVSLTALAASSSRSGNGESADSMISSNLVVSQES